MTVLIYILIFLIGASVFSFLNVVIYRVPNQMDFVKGRSFCPTCGHSLNGRDMVPVFGWIFLGGRCRYCKEKVSIRYMLVEAFGGFVALGCVFKYGYNLQTLIVFAFFGMLTVIALVDIDTMEIPNGFVIAVFIIGIVSWFCFPEITIIQRVVGMVVVSGPLLLITLVIPGAFGGGDIKLMAASGIFLGWKLSLVSLFLAILTGGFYGIYLLVTRKKGRREHFAFGPFLCAGMAVGFLWGEQLLNWYLGYFFY